MKKCKSCGRSINVLEEIALRATSMPEFKEAVAEAGEGPLRAIREVRVLLRKHFPEIKDIPVAESSSKTMDAYGLKLGSLGNDFIIARHVVNLLR